MMYVSRATLFTIFSFIALTGGQQVYHYKPEFFLLWVSMVLGMTVAYLFSVFGE